MNFPPTKCPS